MLDNCSEKIFSTSYTCRFIFFFILINEKPYNQVDPNDVVGHIPFIKNGVMYPWSKLDPMSVSLSVAVMPDCQHLLHKDLITSDPPAQGPVLTVFAPRSFRYFYNENCKKIVRLFIGQLCELITLFSTSKLVSSWI